MAILRPFRVTVQALVIRIEGNGTPSTAPLATVTAELNDEIVRPLCDTVEIVLAEILPYQV